MMRMSLEKLAGFTIALCISATVAAQEKAAILGQKNKEALDKLQSAPNTSAEFGKSITGKPEPAEMKSATANSESASPRISPAGKRDPFRPFTLNARSASGRRRENLSPLERYDLGQLKLVAVIWNVKEPSAMVEDSSGLGYLVRVGTPIGANEGKVKAIQRNAIVIEEFDVDLYGARKKHEVNMRLYAENAG